MVHETVGFERNISLEIPNMLIKVLDHFECNLFEAINMHIPTFCGAQQQHKTMLVHTAKIVVQHDVQFFLECLQTSSIFGFDTRAHTLDIADGFANFVAQQQLKDIEKRKTNAHAHRINGIETVGTKRVFIFRWYIHVVHVFTHQ